jgi:1A family penicillin-binding protein
MNHLRRLSSSLIKHLRRSSKRKIFFEVALLAISGCVVLLGASVLWISTLQLPDLSAFDQRKVIASTKIYDRTGTILLYDVNKDIKRTLVPNDQIAQYVKDATVAIEDQDFYKNHGIEPLSIMRAFLTDLSSLHFSEGGSTITQQVIKNSFLTSDKTITRKIKEWVLAIRLDATYSKDTILGIYLNEVPYGGNIYGVEEASEQYFGIPASKLDLAQSAYLASIPQAPTHLSPFGNNVSELEARKNLVLEKMLELNYITKDQYTSAKQEKVEFNQPTGQSIKAPHFVFYVLDQLTQKYGEDTVQNGGLKVITTLDYDLQSKGEQIVSQYAMQNETKFGASNAGLVAIDPKTGQILTMVGSRNYFDTEIDGQYNVTLAKRQPGSTFKPFAYSVAFSKGYTPDTVLFDLPTEFSTDCDPQGNPIPPLTSTTTCYMPQNYDSKYRGPMSLRDALAQSINIPSIETLYLAGVPDTLSLAKQMGITTLGDASQYGLTLVLGGGEVSLLDMTSAYSVFANEGIRNPYTAILEVDDRSGNILNQYQASPTRVLDKQTSLEITDVLSDNVARTPEFGSASPLYFPGYDVAAKTGTTNDYRDMWTIGYTPTITVGTWAGNNDNTPTLKGQIAGFVVAPMWNAFMQEALKVMPKENFERPQPIDESTLKPVLQGIWQGGQAYWVNSSTGELATDLTPKEDRQEKVVPAVHSILYWVDKNNPLGPAPADPQQDPQFERWEYAARKWAQDNGYTDGSAGIIPTRVDSIHTADAIPQVSITSPAAGVAYASSTPITITVTYGAKYPITLAQFYFNGTYLGSDSVAPFNFSFTPSQVGSSKAQSTIGVVLTDSQFNRGMASTTISIAQ